MKSTERHRIKEDQFIATLADTFERFDQNRQQWLWTIAGVVVLVVAVSGVSWWYQQRNAKASAMLAEAMVVAEAPVVPATPPTPPGQAAGTPPAASTPPPGSYPTERAKLEAALPKFVAAGDAYPSTAPGLSARYQAAATLVSLGRDAEAAQRFQEVIDRDGSGLYGRMARLGLAEVQVRQGKYDPAIATYKELSATAKDELPVDGILMALGKAYVAAGKKAEASQTFKRIGDEFPTSPYAPEAKKQLDTLSAAG